MRIFASPGILFACPNSSSNLLLSLFLSLYFSIFLKEKQIGERGERPAGRPLGPSLGPTSRRPAHSSSAASKAQPLPSLTLALRHLAPFPRPLSRRQGQSARSRSLLFPSSPPSGRHHAQKTKPDPHGHAPPRPVPLSATSAALKPLLLLAGKTPAPPPWPSSSDLLVVLPWTPSSKLRPTLPP